MTVGGRRNKWLRWLLLTLALNVLFFSGWWLVVRLLVVRAYIYRPSYRVAEYDGFRVGLSVDGDRVVLFSVWTEDSNMAPPEIFLQKNGVQPLLFAHITEDWVNDSAGDEEWIIQDLPVNRRYYLGKGVSPSAFEFAGGKLNSLQIRLDNSVFKFGPSSDGPFVSLPVPIDEFISIFGEPRKWSKQRSSGGV